MNILDCFDDMLSNSRYYNQKYDIAISGSAPLGTGFVVIKKEYMDEFAEKLQEFEMEVKEIRKNETEAIKLREAAEEMFRQAKGQCLGDYNEEKESPIKKSSGEPSSFYFPLGDI